MGGRITVTSALGEGATFEVLLPLPPASSSGAAAPAQPNLAGLGALIVAPSSIEAALMGRRLTDWGARTCVVLNEAAALALLCERPWDAILVDLALGPDVCRRLGEAAAGVARRIVVLTPSARSELPALQHAGFSGYLVKPVRAASLAARLGADTMVMDEEHAARDWPIAVRQAAAAQGFSVLVVEDNEINALLARALLTKLGHRPKLVNSGGDAVAAWQAALAAGEPFDLVLMDVHMPGGDGIEATRSIRALEAELCAGPTRIVALTANAFEEDRVACLAAGMDDFVTKPLDRERLARALAAASRGSIAA
jgi:CheY-like chemotaxis protein